VTAAQSPQRHAQTSWGRRVLALCVDWLASTLIVVGVIGIGGWSDDNLSGFYTLGVFLAQSTVLTALLGGSFGKLLTRLRVVRADGSGRPPDPLRALLRQAMVCLVIPPLVFRPDGRGLHDLMTGTTTVAFRPAE
jgi:uncharacterized RDD family membrane protein YckC